MSHVIDFNILFKQLGTFRSVPLLTIHHSIMRISYLYEIFWLKKVRAGMIGVLFVWHGCDGKVPSEYVFGKLNYAR